MTSTRTGVARGLKVRSPMDALLLEIETGAVDRSPVHLDSVVPRVSAPIFHSTRGDEPLEDPDVMARPGDELAPDGSPPIDVSIRWPAGLTIGVPPMLFATSIAIAVSIAQHDLVAGLFVAAVVAAAAVLRNASRRATFTFGEGFLGYRSDMGWPRGVQEDDEVRWNWRTHPADASR